MPEPIVQPMPATDQLPAGWLLEEEAAWLSAWAKDKLILELGCYLGRSTVAMARTAKHVVTVDHFQGSVIENWYQPQDSLPAARANFARFGVAGKITVVVAELRNVAAFKLLGTSFDGVFVDAGHDDANVRRDAELAYDACGDWGWIVFDDYGWPDVHRLVDELAERTGRRTELLAGRKMVRLIDRAAKPAAAGG